MRAAIVVAMLMVGALSLATATGGNAGAHCSKVCPKTGACLKP